MKRSTIIQEVLDVSGGIRALSQALNLTYSAVHKWRGIPSEHVKKIEAITGISRDRLRPDIYG